MALLTAEDILNKKFSATKFREGYDVEEVDDFLDEVVRTLNSVQEENEDLKSKLAAAERRIAELSRADASSAAVQAPVVDAPQAPEPEPAPAAPISQAVVSKNAAEPESATGMLQLAQKLHDDYVRSGQEEGDRLIAEAKEEGSRIVREAEETSHRTLSQLEQERSLLERKIDELRIFERDYRTRLKSYLQNLLGDLDNRGSALPPRSNVGGAARTSDLAPGL
ncbi:DivIVA domain-containing protein [Cellulosimicrobium composti]|uniref:Cell wall synthesis protein Wag31 n=1 Tax=Cellulosimicrobium composti TaxID=2672572 RepID=A0A6N7ZMS1_9MICO|nr:MULTISPECIES: DivIVA domain-containing protein [Cellulosimicrobium]TWG82314.1 DivIVA domain-containing protein [Cellulosimicrobium cellulans J34]SMF33949.1 DivIVA domain-containing protein [Cellulosimicrobium cellulans J1]KFD43691.1 cell division protein DivIVA [Cellulosimicrobium sp. MM]MTG90784.1 DivIVA domain-containing protein [Cellulosimicrobium composti]NDO89710.1 DivIVA domain-containing protein [Cellulosimicrobium composti]